MNSSTNIEELENQFYAMEPCGANMPYCLLVDNKCIKERCEYVKYWFVCQHVRHAIERGTL